MSYCMVCVDGTGPLYDAEYAATMEGSFCLQIADQLSKHADYQRGPSNLGSECKMFSDWAVGRLRLGQQRRQRLFLAGYSRGGAIVIDAARQFGGDIEALFLFDAVDKTTTIDAYQSQCNVRYVYHVLRDRTIADPFLSLDQKYSRSWFQNCGLRDQWPGRTTYWQHRVAGASHAAVGGVPWPERPEDKPALRATAVWMTNNLQARGLPVKLKDLFFDTHREREYQAQQAVKAKAYAQRANYGPKF